MVVALVVAIWYFRWICRPGRRRGENNICAAGHRVREIRILCGSSAARHVDRPATSVWRPLLPGRSVFAAPNHKFSRRPIRTCSGTDAKRFQFDIPLKPGVYELHLYFAETYSARTTARERRVQPGLPDLINGKPCWDLRTRSPTRAAATLRREVFKDVSPAPDHMLHVQLARWSITLLSSCTGDRAGHPGKMRPVRIVARPRNYTDQRGQCGARPLL